MALSWNEIKDRALQFTVEWEGESRERAEKDTFWNEFLNVFGISRRRVATFEKAVQKLNNQQGFIDLFWKGTLLVEHKSLGKDLDAAYEQATDYFYGLEEYEIPQYILVSDFANFRLYDLDTNQVQEFPISEFHKNIKLFGFIAGFQKRTFEEENPVNIHAAELLGKFHDQLEESGYRGHPLEVYLVRILFCLFADDTGIFEKDTFKELIEIKTNVDGSDLGALLAHFFQVLNTPKENRLTNLDEHVAAFLYVNGKLFEEALPIAAFNSNMREILLECCGLDWGLISPAIFGSMFQSVMNPEERRNLGAHYTSETNILKLIKPLFLDDLWKTFHKVRDNKKQLLDFHESLSRLKFLDPACGCGNFLVVTYRELRILELAIIKVILFKYQRLREEVASEAALDISHLVKINVDQFYGIEYDEFPVRIAEVAMWLMDHQMNLQISEVFGTYFARLPLTKSATIIHDNALRRNWEDVIPKNELSFILGNPPFCGKQYQSKEQKEDMSLVFKGVNGSGVLDYVSAWYLMAAKLIRDTTIKVAFVSTNSIAQGEQTGILWNELFNNYGIKIHFAHRTFKWSNEARGVAAVYVVIIGFSNNDVRNKYIFEYEDVKGEPHEIKVKNINPYLVEGKDVVILKRRTPICNVSEISFGNMPNDGGFLLLTDKDKKELLENEPDAQKVIKPLLSANEVLNSIPRWCIWLDGVAPKDIRRLKEISKRIQKVKETRLNSSREATRRLADFPTLFGEIRQPQSDFVFVPLTTSENRQYIPLSFFDKTNIPNNTASVIPDATLYEFGVMHSLMHMSWVKYTCGRLKGDFRYSNEIVYNNFPWPINPSVKNREQVEVKAQKVLDARAQYPDSSLADLYDPLTMPPKLTRAHQELDRAVDLCYRPQAFTNEMARIEFLFGLYEEYMN
ncbi:MAG: class I SAM-dependent DNA methyltransferase [Bacteroidetes bacterium]|nr:class I SAM-dependent DNA methyltransferase [Bacteroidota bacterium]